VHSSLSNKSETDELGLESSSGNSLDVESVVDSSPLGDSLVHGRDLSDNDSVGESESQPDGSEVSFLDELEVMVSASSSKLNSE